MQAANIDTLLNVATPAAKVSPANSPRDGSEQFDNYLRDAAETKLSSERPIAEAKPTKDEPLAAATGQEQGSTPTPDQETIPTKQAEATTEVGNNEAIIDEDMRDEFILSAAGGAVVNVEVIVEVPVDLEQTSNSAEIVDQTAAKVEMPSEASPANEQLPSHSHIVDPEEGTTIGSGEDNKNAKKSIPIESDLVAAESVEVAKNGGLTPVVEAPKATVAPKPTKPIIPEKSTESGSDNEVIEADVIDAAIVEAIAKVVEAAPVTADSPSIEAKAETPAPASQPLISGSPNQPQPVQSQGSQAEVPAQRAEGDSNMPPIDRARFVQRVANAFRSAQQNDGQIQMRLSPPELGSLKIEIAVRNGVLSANLEAETPDARRVLLDNLPALRQRLAEQDIRIDKFEVDIRREGGEQQGQAEAQQQQTEQQSQRAAARNRIRTTPTSEVTTAPRALLGKPAVAPDGLDVRV